MLRLSKEQKKRINIAFTKPHFVFIALALPFSIISAFLTPPLIVADETQHLLRSYSIVKGDILPKDQGSYDCEYPNNLADYVDKIHDNPRLKPESQQILHEGMDHDKVKGHYCGTAVAYSPVLYIPQTIGTFLASLFDVSLNTTVLLARVFNAVFYSFVLFFIIKYVRVGKWAFVAVGLLPVSIHYAGSISADPANNLIVLGFIAFVLNLFYDKKLTLKRGHYITLFILVALLAVTKPQNLSFIALLPFLPATLFKANPKYLKQIPFNVHKWLTGAAVLAVAAISYKVASATTAIAQGAYSAASEKILSSPIFFIEVLWETYISPFSEGAYNSFVFNGLVSGFSSYSWYLPSIVTFLCLFALVISLLYRDNTENLRKNEPSRGLIIGSLLSIVSLVLLVTYAMYTVWATLPIKHGLDATFADGVQGRYFLAALVLLSPLFMWLGKYIQVRPSKPWMFGCFIFISFLVSLSFYTIHSVQFLQVY